MLSNSATYLEGKEVVRWDQEQEEAGTLCGMFWNISLSTSILNM